MRRALLAALGLLAAGCGDNILVNARPLRHADDLAVVAHQDDDLLFMQPDLVEAAQARRGLTIVYVTAGNGTKGLDYTQTRDDGVRAAYADAVGESDWACGQITLADHAAESCTLPDAKLTLVFLGYPDGGKQGEQPASLLHLWEGTADHVTTIARRTTTYDRPGLIATLAEIMTEVTPTTVHTLEVAATHGHDHADHMLVGALTILAEAVAHLDVATVAYRGYSIDAEPANKPGPLNANSAEALGRYDACVLSCGAVCFESGCPDPDPAHVTWLARRYAVGFRRAPGTTLTGVLRLGGACLIATAGGAIDLGDCASATPVTFLADGELATGDRCLQTLITGELVAGRCDPGASHAFLLDDEGHVWLGAPPPAQPGLDGTHLQCLVGGADHVRAGLCGAGADVRWQLLPAAPVTTPRAGLGLTQTGRAIRLGDLTGDGWADLCEARASGLWCAPGDGRGGFRAAVRLDDPADPLTIEPHSLALGDVDGDGHPDACGRTAAGVSCALAADHFAPTLISTAFAAAGPPTNADRALTIVDADGDGRPDLCGRTAAGVTCVTAHGVSLRSAWPAATDEVYLADLDGDRHTDLCALTPTGPACAVDAERALTTDAAPWAFFQGGAIDPPLAGATPDLTALADVDGDHQADLCAVSAGVVACARSQGDGLGPAFPMLVTPAASPATALWLGDLDGDGKADPCVATATDVTCARSP